MNCHFNSRGVQIFPDNQELPQNSMCQKGRTKQVSEERKILGDM